MPCLSQQIWGVAGPSSRAIAYSHTPATAVKSVADGSSRSNRPFVLQQGVLSGRIVVGPLDTDSDQARLLTTGGQILTSSTVHKILIVDDHTLMRSGLEAMLLSESAYEVVGVAADGKSAIRSADELQPDLILMDLTMPLTSGIDAIVQIKRLHPHIRIVALTFHKEDEYIHATLEAGADGYVLKDDSRTELLTALASVLNGKSYLSPAICDKVVAGYLSVGEDSAKELSWEILTRREREVIKLIAEGKRTKDIATYLSLSPKTIEKHRANLMKKLNLRSVSAVTAYAIQNGFVSE
jgi:DNA-binding NarL/FixJ family response regulator